VLTFNFLNDNNGLFIAGGQPAINATTGTLTFTPAANTFGMATVTVTLSDDGGTAGGGVNTSAAQTFVITVNSPGNAPTINNITDPAAILEDAGLQTINFSGVSDGGDPQQQTITITASSNNPAVVPDPSVSYVGSPVPAATGSLSYTPVADANGTAIITVTVRDSGLDLTPNTPDDLVTTKTFNVVVTAVNDAPSFAASAPTVLEDAAAQTVPGFVMSFNPGAANETQTPASYIVSNVQAGFFAVAPVVAANGTLTYTLNPNVNGPGTFQLQVVDSGDTLNGGVNTSSPPQTITINVTPVNDMPSFTASAPTVLEDAAAQTVPGFITSFNPGAANETQTAASYIVSNVQAGFFAVAPVVAANGTLTYTLNPNVNGPGTFQLQVVDSGDTLNGGVNTSNPPQTITINVTDVNDAPTITIGGNQQVLNGAPAQTVNGFASMTSFGPANESTQTLVGYQVSNNNNALFSSQPTISPAGVLTYTPAAGLGGTATVTVRGQDSGGVLNGGVDLSPALTFTIIVDAPITNSPPTLGVIGNVIINEDASLQTVNLSGISGGTDAPPQTVTVTASSDNTAVVPNPTVIYTSPNALGSLTFIPVANANGMATITVTVTDSGLDLTPGNGDDLSVTRTFTVTVNAVNDQPSFTAAGNPTPVNEDAGAQNVAGFITSFTSGGGVDEAGQLPTYNVSAVSNASLFSAQPTINAAGQLSYTPTANAFGTSTFQVTVNDGGGTANSGVDTSAPQTFTITVNAVNDAPSFVIGPNRTTPNTAGPQTLPGQATSISFGPANEAPQTVTFLVSNNNGALFLSPPAIASNGTLTFTPAAGASGMATVTVQAQDSGGTLNGGIDLSPTQTFTITIQNNNPPTLDPLGNLVINQNAGNQAVSLTGIGTGGEVQPLSVTASSSDINLIPTPTLSYISPNATGTLNFAPALNQIGSATITVTVRDSGFDGILNNGDDATIVRTFTVQVNDVNDPPVANDQTLPAVMNTPVNGTLTASDPDGPTLTYSIFASPSLGMITSFNSSTGAFTYTPNTNATGLDIFTFQVTDGEFTDQGQVRIAIQGTQPVVMVNGGDLLVIGTPDPDTIIISHLSAGVVRVRTDLGSATFPVSGQLIVNSGQGNDYVVANGILVPTTLDLAEGDDYGSSGLQDDTIIGGAGDDQINASGGVNLIWGDTVGEQDLATGGKDIISSLGGNDTIYGGGQNDQIFPGDGDDYVNAGQGDDVVSAGAGNDRVYGGAGADQLYGDEGNDLLSGGDGGDVLVGRTGSDVLIGGLGADSINGDEGTDLLFANNTTNSASSTRGDANDLALMAMLATWATSQPAGLANSVSAGNDGSPDSLQGFTSNDDFYVSSNDATGDFGLPGMGTDRYNSI
jgi:hypothetical protein